MTTLSNHNISAGEVLVEISMLDNMRVFKLAQLRVSDSRFFVWKKKPKHIALLAAICSRFFASSMTHQR